MKKKILFFLMLLGIFTEMHIDAKDFIYRDVIDENGKRIEYKDLHDVKITISLKKSNLDKSKLQVTILNISKSAINFTNQDFTSFVIFNSVTLGTCMHAIERYTYSSEFKVVIQPGKSVSYYVDFKKLIGSCAIDVNKKENKLLSISLMYSVNKKSIFSNDLEIEF